MLRIGEAVITNDLSALGFHYSNRQALKKARYHVGVISERVLKILSENEEKIVLERDALNLLYNKIK